VQVVDEKSAAKNGNGDEDDDEEEKLPPVDEALLEEIMALGFPEVMRRHHSVFPNPGD